MPKAEKIASSDNLLGQLQRGRGKGYVELLSAPRAESHKLLIECICNDPRLDSQVESRAEYYASIAMEVSLDLAAVADYLREYDDTGQSSWSSSLAVQTLGELAKRGYG